MTKKQTSVAKVNPTSLSDVLSMVQAHHHARVATAAKTIADEILSGELADVESVDEAIDEQINEATTTNLDCQEIILSSDNSDYALEVVTTEGWSGKIRWGAWAQRTFEEDVKDELLERHKIKWNEPEEARKAAGKTAP